MLLLLVRLRGSVAPVFGRCGGRGLGLGVPFTRGVVSVIDPFGCMSLASSLSIVFIINH
jgi:hypothetical protein